MKIGLLGGTFDPVHRAHLCLAKAAMKQLRLDRVIFVPAGRPPHKSSELLAPANDRLAMIRLAVLGQTGILYSDWELRRKSISYTIQTLAHFRKLYPRATLYFLMGADSLSRIRTWRDKERLWKFARFVVARRPGTLWQKIPAMLRRNIIPLSLSPLLVSSSAIRARAAQGLSLRGLVAPKVARYIKKRRLYQGD